MKPRRWWLSLVFFLPLIAFAGALWPAFAAEGGEPNPAEEPLGTVFRWLNFALVAGAGIIGADVGGYCQPCCSNLVLLLVKDLMVLGQDAVQLARRDVGVVLPQLLQQQRLRDVRLMVLVQDVGDQVRPEVPAGNRQNPFRKRR